MSSTLAQSTPAAPSTTPQSSSLEPSDIDPAVSAMDDFYLHANGGWLARYTIPPDASAIGTWATVGSDNFTRLKGILESAAGGADTTSDDNVRKLGHFYGSGLDTAAIENAGIEPLRAELVQIDAMTTIADVYRMVAYAQLNWSGSLFDVGIQKDGNSERILPLLSQAGLGLPVAAQYSDIDTDSVSLRSKYLQHITRMLTLLGESGPDPGARAQAVLTVETRLAAISTGPVALYPAERVAFGALAASLSNFNLQDYFAAIGAPAVDFLYVSPRSFFDGLGEILSGVPVEDWKDYFRWRLVKETAPYLPDRFAQENFNFFSKELQGTPLPPPRWSSVANVVNSLVQDLVGREYVVRYFSQESREKAIKIIESLRTAFRDRIMRSDWLGEATKQKAVAKLNAMDIQVGYPAEWIDYAGLEIQKETTYVTNVLLAGRHALTRTLRKIGMPQDRNEWVMAAQTLNSYNNPFKNQIVFPAAMWQSPFFDPAAPDALNYGAIGAVVGHEMTHGFDKSGRLFDANGNTEDWWTSCDATEFENRAKVMVAQVDNCTIQTSTGLGKLNGELSLDETIADLGGLLISWDALHAAGDSSLAQGQTQMSHDVMFFYAWARLWRAKVRPELMLQLLKTDPHPPARFRINLPLTNADPFYSTFPVLPQNSMFRRDDSRVRIW